MSEPSPRQVLYALVAGGFALVVAILTAGGALAGIVPAWWSVTLSVSIVAIGVWMVLNWRKTIPVLAFAIGLFVLWLVGTLILVT